MIHSRSWDKEIRRPSVENVTLGLRRRVTFQPRVRHIPCPTHYRVPAVKCAIYTKGMLGVKS